MILKCFALHITKSYYFDNGDDVDQLDHHQHNIQPCFPDPRDPAHRSIVHH